MTREEILNQLKSARRPVLSAAAKSVGLHVYREDSNNQLLDRIIDCLTIGEYELDANNAILRVLPVSQVVKRMVDGAPKPQPKGRRGTNHITHPCVDDWTVLNPDIPTDKAYISVYKKGAAAAAAGEAEEEVNHRYPGPTVLSRRFRAWWRAGWHSVK